MTYMSCIRYTILCQLSTYSLYRYEYLLLNLIIVRVVTFSCLPIPVIFKLNSILYIFSLNKKKTVLNDLI